MPGGDRTGPDGFGPMTGRGMGFCAGYDTPGYMSPGFGLRRGAGFGRGRGMGRGGGFGRRNMYYATGLPGWARGGYYDAPYPPAAPLSAKDEIDYLKRESEMLKNSLKEIDERIKELNKRAGEEK